MLVAAERLIATEGLHGVSLRGIGLAAGQRNNSAVQYHFESLDGVVRGVLELRMEPVNEARVALLAELAAQGRTGEVRGLVEAVVCPFVEAIGDRCQPTFYARFLQAVAFDPEWRLFDTLDDPVMRGLRAVFEQLQAALRHLPESVRDQRLDLVARLVVSALADEERAAERLRGSGGERALIVAGLVDAVVGVLDAPMSATTQRELAAAQQVLA
jgi:AcrR family transcriptional regulator